LPCCYLQSSINAISVNSASFSPRKTVTAPALNNISVHYNIHFMTNSYLTGSQSSAYLSRRMFSTRHMSAKWPMMEFEADDALASAATKAAKDKRVRQAIICTSDKDLSQCVVGSRVVQLDRRREGPNIRFRGVVDSTGYGVTPDADLTALQRCRCSGPQGQSEHSSKKRLRSRKMVAIQRTTDEEAGSTCRLLLTRTTPGTEAATLSALCFTPSFST